MVHVPVDHATTELGGLASAVTVTTGCGRLWQRLKSRDLRCNETTDPGASLRSLTALDECRPARHHALLMLFSITESDHDQCSSRSARTSCSPRRESRSIHSMGMAEKSVGYAATLSRLTKSTGGLARRRSSWSRYGSRKPRILPARLRSKRRVIARFCARACMLSNAAIKREGMKAAGSAIPSPYPALQAMIRSNEPASKLIWGSRSGQNGAKPRLS
jgi:hypothetical protein